MFIYLESRRIKFFGFREKIGRVMDSPEKRKNFPTLWNQVAFIFDVLYCFSKRKGQYTCCS